MPVTFYLASLGCPKNRVDAERLWAAAARRGLQAVTDPAQADIIVVNSCAFIRAAVRESLETVLELARFKRQGRCRKLALMGCLPARYGKDLAAELAEVDLFVGPGQTVKLLRWMCADLRGRTPLPRTRPAVARVNSLSPAAAYLKVAEGCSRRCSFCLIPQLRGPQRSRPLTELVAEARALCRSGVKELVLVAQDLAAWGKDLPGRQRLPQLLQALAEVRGLAWLRVMYLFPGDVSMELVDVIRSHANILPYLDIPFQHVDRRILKSMRRGGSFSEARRLIERLRRRLPGVVLRTSLMTGFPGEDEKAFALLEKFVRQCRFERLGVFVFSPEEGTAAVGLPGAVPRRLAEQRRRRLMQLQQGMALSYHRSLLGKKIEVLVEKKLSAGRLVGRAWCQAPEVDGRTLLRGPAGPGDLVLAEVTGAGPYDLEAEVLECPTNDGRR